MTHFHTFAVVRPDQDHWGDPIVVLIAERPTLAEAEELAAKHLARWPGLWVEEWQDSGYERIAGKRVWRVCQSSKVVRTFAEAS